MTEIGSTRDAGTTPEARQLRLRSPALFLALAFAAGVGLAGSGHAAPVELFRSIPVLIAASALCVLIAAILLRADRNRVAAAVTLGGFVFAGALASLLFSFRFPPDHIAHLGSWGIDTARPVNVEGTLRTDCVLIPAGYEFDLDVATVGQGSGEQQISTRRASGKIRVQVAAAKATESSADSMLALHSGDRVRAMMRLRQPHAAFNPGSFDFRKRAANIEDLYWEGSVDDPAELQRLSIVRQPQFERAIEAVRARLRRAIDRLYPPWSVEGRDGAVLKAILLGDRTSLDSATIDHFRASGLYHLLVIAGLHVGLIAALVLGLLRLLGLNRRWRNTILLAVLLAYALVVEQRAPTLRATLMLVIFLLAQFLGRDHSALNAVGLAALALLLTRPAWLFESGFQLSFAAALLIVGLAAPVLRSTLEPYRNALRHLEDVERDTALAPRQAQFRLDLRMVVSLMRRRSALLNRYPAVARRLVVLPLESALWLAGMVVFSAVLQIGLLLPMVEQFHRVTLAGVGLNAVALPLMGILLAVAIPTVLVAVAAPSVAVWPAKLLTVIFHALFAVAEWPHLPAWLSYRVPSPPPWVAIGFAISLIGLAVSFGRRRRALLVCLACFAIFGVMLTAAPFAPNLQSGVFGVTALDCGGGEAVFFVLPDRTTVLVGAGGTGRPRPPQFALTKRWDPGENIVSPYLWSRRIKALDVVVVTSAAGNLDGFTSILQNFRVGEIWFRDSDAGLPSILEEAARRGVNLRAISPGESLKLGGTLFDVLAPPEDAALPAGVEQLVMRVTSGEATALVASSLSIRGQQQILESNPNIRSLVLATGRNTLVWATDSNRPLAAQMPAAGSDPQPGSRDRYNATGSSQLQAANHTFATDRDGAITVEMKGASLQIRTFETLH